MIEEALRAVSSDNPIALMAAISSENNPDLRLPSDFSLAQQMQANPPLISVSAFAGAMKCFNTLRFMGANIRLRDNNGREPIHFAAIQSRTQILSLLLSLGVPVEITDVFFAIAMLSFSLLWGHPIALWRPIHFAADAGNIEAARILCAHKADLNSITSANTTARFWASINKHHTVEEFLLAHGALDSEHEYQMIMSRLEPEKKK